jgi:hypothetical protein
MHSPLYNALYINCKSETPFSVSTSRLLATDLNTETCTSITASITPKIFQSDFLYRCTITLYIFTGRPPVFFCTSFHHFLSLLVTNSANSLTLNNYLNSERLCMELSLYSLCTDRTVNSLLKVGTECLVNNCAATAGYVILRLLSRHHGNAAERCSNLGG